MMKYLATLIAFCIPYLISAQCAMCRTQIKNNVSHGETELAAGLNNGIMFLFFTPYIIVGVIAFLWYKYSRTNDQTFQLIERLKRQMIK
jgi:hypothetical protein